MPKPGELCNNYPLLLERENKIKLLESFKGSKKHHNMQCLVCNHIWSATPISKRQTLKKNGVTGCPQCNNTRKEQQLSDKHQQTINELKHRGICILSDYVGLHTTTQKLTFKNNNCGHTFETYPGNVINRGTNCIICGIAERTSVINQWSKQNSKTWRQTASKWNQYKAEVTKLTELTYEKHKKLINPNNFPRGKAGTDGAYHLDHKVPKRFCFDNNIPAEVCAHVDNLQMLSWQANVGSRSTLKGDIPYLFLQYINHHHIDEYKTRLLQSLEGFDTESMIDGVYVSMFNKQHAITVIIIPLTKSFANQKYNKTAAILHDNGIRFLFVFEDELITNYELVLSKIKHYTKQNTKTKSIHARKCEIRTIDKQTKSRFLNQFHLQGNDSGQVNYGAFFQDQLIAVMTFCAPRVASGHKKLKEEYGGMWELSRFCTDVGIRIPGIAGKLLKHFQRNNQWNQIFSYADRRWSVGNLYETLGFDLKHTNPPDYRYVIGGTRKHRWNYRKDIIKNTLPDYDNTLTEYQNMVNHGYWRVWDCGTLKYIKYNNII